VKSVLPTYFGGEFSRGTFARGTVS